MSSTRSRGRPAGHAGVQVYGTDLIDDVAYDEIVAMVEKFDDRDHGMNVLDARVHLHEHDETRRGRPLSCSRGFDCTPIAGSTSPPARATARATR